MKSLNNFLSFGGMLAVVLTITNCTVKSPDLTASPRPPAAAVPKKAEPQVFERNFYFARSESTSQQQKFDENTVSALFRVEKDGNSVNDIVEQELRVTENGNPVRPFSLAADQESNNQVADIIFVVDITGTMVELIATAKQRLAEFIKASRKRGFHTRMCFSTFGDYTVKKCTRFYDNNPKDPSTNAQVNELLTELSKLKAHRGEGKDPGYPDLDENPMGALIDAANAPWGQDSQRFVILVTDWGFLYAPENMGKNTDPRKQVPTMKQVTQAIQASQMKVFAVTRTQKEHKGQQLVWDGYNTPFQGEPSIVQSSGGEHFDFDQVLNNQVSLTDILERILMRIKTTYKLTYIVDQVPGLDATLPLAKRNIEISLNNPDRGTAKVASVLSNMPTGHAQYQKVWKLSEQAIQPTSMQVFVDGKEINALDYSVQKGEVHFKTVPPAGAKIRFSFLYESIEQNFRIEPLTFTGGLNSKNTTVYLNGKEARREELILDTNLEGNTSLTLADSVMSANDPYDIRRNEALKIRIVVE